VFQIVTRPNQALAVAATAMLLVAFVGTASNIAVPVLEDEFPEAGLTTVSWVVSSFNVAQVTFMLLGGRLADRIGRRTVFLRGLVVFAVGAAASGLAPGIELIIAARVVQAVGVAMMLPSSLAAVLPEFPAERHASVVSLWSSMGIFGAAVAPTAAAGILQVSSWRVVFLAAVPIAAIALVAGSRVMAPGNPAEHPPPLDLVGAASGTVAIGGLTFAIVQGRVWGWTSPSIVAVATLAALAMAVFVSSSRRHPEPLLDLELLNVPTFSVTTVATSLIAASTAATWFLYPLFMTEVWNYSLIQIGLAMTPGPAVLVVLAPLAGRLADRHGHRPLLVIGALAATAATAWMAWRLQPDTTYLTAFLPGTVGIGIGMGLMLGPANAAALSTIDDSQLGAANAAYNTARMTAMALGIAVVAAIIGDAPAGERLDEFKAGWWAMTVIMAAGPLLLIARYPDR
jgi:EmrB/QacA subfamily drug resistance transporter